MEHAIYYVQNEKEKVKLIIKINEVEKHKGVILPW